MFFVFSLYTNRIVTGHADTSEKYARIYSHANTVKDKYNSTNKRKTMTVAYFHRDD